MGTSKENSGNICTLQGKKLCSVGMLVIFREKRKKSGDKCKERAVQTRQGSQPKLEISATYLANSLA